MFYGLLCFLLAVFGSFVWLVATVVLARLLMYVLTCAAVPLLRKRAFQFAGVCFAGGYLVPFLGIAACG